MILSARIGFLYQCPVFVYNEVTKNRTIMHYKTTTFIWKRMNIVQELIGTKIRKQSKNTYSTLYYKEN